MRERARQFLVVKAQGKASVKDIDYLLDCNEQLCLIKDKELQAEIMYRSYRMQKEQFKNEFESACEQGRNIRTEMRNLNDTISKEEK